MVDFADLAAIPEGPALPTAPTTPILRNRGRICLPSFRRELKRAVPNATTLRDAGHDPTTRLPISDVDAALIPNGTPFPSTSLFLAPPPADTPLVLLPVRLGARF